MGALQLKYRPINFDEVVGNKGVIDTLYTILKRDLPDIPQAWLFQGPPGCGKTTLARILRTELGITDINFQEINASDDRSVGNVRNIIDCASRTPLGKDPKQVFLFDEAHKLTNEAQNALLKLLEDTPEDSWIFLATTDPNKLLPAIKSRCTIITVDRVNTRDIKTLLTEVIETEGYENFPKEVIAEIIRNANGACRDALKLLDTVIDMSDTDTMIEAIAAGYMDETSVKDLWNALLMKGSVKLKWGKASNILSTMKGEPEQIRMALLTIFTNNLLADGSKISHEKATCFRENYYDSGKAGLILDCFEVCNID